MFDDRNKELTVKDVMARMSDEDLKEWGRRLSIAIRRGGKTELISSAYEKVADEIKRRESFQ